VLLQPTYDGESWIYGTPTTTSFFYATSAVGDGVPIWWQSSDAKVLASASTMMPTNGATTGTLLTLSTALPTSMPSNSSGLTTGTKIGIGIGIPVAVIAGLVMGLLSGMKRRRDRKVNGSGAEHEGWIAEHKDMPVVPAYTTGQTQELKSNARHELHDGDRGSRHEIHDGDSGSRHELPGVAPQ
jgi:hypothetical protein